MNVFTNLFIHIFYVFYELNMYFFPISLQSNYELTYVFFLFLSLWNKSVAYSGCSCWKRITTDNQRLNSQWEGWEDLQREDFLLLSLFERVFQKGEFDPDGTQPFSLHTTETSCQSQCSYCTEMGCSLSGCSQSCPHKKRWARGGRRELDSYTLESPEEVQSLLSQVHGRQHQWESNLQLSSSLIGLVRIRSFYVHDQLLIDLLLLTFMAFMIKKLNILLFTLSTYKVKQIQMALQNGLQYSHFCC